MTDHLGKAPFEKQGKEITFDSTTKVLGTWGGRGWGEEEGVVHEPGDMCLAVFQERYN